MPRELVRSREEYIRCPFCQGVKVVADQKGQMQTCMVCMGKARVFDRSVYFYTHRTDTQPVVKMPSIQEEPAVETMQ